MVTLEPIMGLLTNLIPLKSSFIFFDNFFKYGWKFFYSLFLVFLDEIEDDLMREENTSYEIIKIIKAYSTPWLPTGGE